jgi:hypothetical protein
MRLDSGELDESTNLLAFFSSRRPLGARIDDAVSTHPIAHGA